MDKMSRPAPRGQQKRRRSLNPAVIIVKGLDHQGGKVNEEDGRLVANVSTSAAQLPVPPGKCVLEVANQNSPLDLAEGSGLRSTCAEGLRPRERSQAMDLDIANDFMACPVLGRRGKGQWTARGIGRGGKAWSGGEEIRADS